MSGVVGQLANALAGRDGARIYPTNPSGNGVVLREGVVSGAAGSLTVPVRIGGAAVAVPVRYLGEAPLPATKVIVVMQGQMIYCLPASSDNTLRPASSAYLSVPQSLATGVATVIAFNNTTFDTNICVNTSNGNYTCPLAGYYWVGATITMTTAATGITFCSVFKNGAETKRGTQFSLNVPSPSPVVTGLIPCAVGDILTLVGYQGSGGALNTYSGAPYVFMDVELRRTL